jgi:hypothetical protein
VNLPLIPQHDHRKSKNNPKNGAAYIVHINGDPVEDEVEEPIFGLLIALF